MGGVRGGSADVRAERERSVRGSGGDSGDVTEQPLAEEIDQEDGDGVDQQEPEVNARDGLAEDGHDYGVRGVSSRKLHVGRDAVWRDALQNELAGVSILAFIALERDGKQVDADESGGEEDEGQDDLGGKAAHHLSDSRIAGGCKENRVSG